MPTHSLKIQKKRRTQMEMAREITQTHSPTIQQRILTAILMESATMLMYSPMMTRNGQILTQMEQVTTAMYSPLTNWSGQILTQMESATTPMHSRTTQARPLIQIWMVLEIMQTGSPKIQQNGMSQKRARSPDLGLFLQSLASWSQFSLVERCNPSLLSIRFVHLTPLEALARVHDALIGRRPDE